MNIIPSIDLYEGRVVRLKQGDFNNKCVYDLDPLEIIKQYEDAGYTDIHIVDLSSAKKGQLDKEQFFLGPFLNTKVNIQFGGGIRKLEDLQFLFSRGIDRVVIGSMAAENSAEVQNWIELFGTDRVILAIDIRLNNGIPMIKTQGWLKDTALSL
jgi:phosphoribosylformimino-5-aminoimidazole carboxamide ribotide isomerase